MLEKGQRDAVAELVLLVVWLASSVAIDITVVAMEDNPTDASRDELLVGKEGSMTGVDDISVSSGAWLDILCCVGRWGLR